MRTFADVRWMAGDVQSLRGGKHWSRKKAEEFLERNENRIRDRLTELGFEVIETLLAEEKSHVVAKSR